MDIEFRALIQKIRAELEALDQARLVDAKTPLLELQQLELELKVVVAGDTSAQGGFDLKVVTAGAAETEHSEAVQTVRLRYSVAPSVEDEPLLGSRAHTSTYSRPSPVVKPIE